ncbi:MAG TPA: hypothetical protein GXX72_03310 [Clostridiaceae bacterium]|nr:hypothetical protein [Clostridiaceae bacterium]
MTEKYDYSHEDEWLKNKGLIDGSENSQQMKTLRSFAYAIITPEDELENKYQIMLDKIANILEDEYCEKITVEPEELIDMVMPSNLFSDIQAVPDKTAVCLQCGKKGEYPLEDVRCFGVRATSGTGKKITSLKENQKFKGRICKLCLIENQIRRDTFPDLIPKPMSKAEPICFQIHMGDYIVPVNISSVLNSLDKSDITINAEKKIIGIGRSEYQIDYHTPTFVNRPKNKTDEFYFIKNTLKLISSTGFKVRITPLFSSDEIFKPTFVWESAPIWTKTLGIDVLRIDQIEGALKELDLIEMVASLGRGPKDLPVVIASITRHPRGLFYITNRLRISSGKKTMSSDIIRGIKWYMEKNRGVLKTMEMREVVEAACDIVYDRPESNNDHTWMISTALETFERNAKASVDDRIQRAAGRLWDYAKRQNRNSGEKVQSSCMDFAVKLNALLQKEYPNGIPSSDARKDLIAQFAIMYNIAKWKK